MIIRFIFKHKTHRKHIFNHAREVKMFAGDHKSV